MNLSHLTTPIVRDLYYAVFGQDLLSAETVAELNGVANYQQAFDFNQSELVEIESWFTELDKNPSQLQSHLANTNTAILGARFESLWLYFLKNCPHLLLRGANLQVQDQGRTLGEFDYIFERGKKNWHLEIALKYYLLAPPFNGQDLSQWIGPQCRDRLSIKYEKTINKQLKLSHSEAGRSTLSDKLAVSEINPITVMKGWLFTPLNPSQSISDNSNQLIHPNHNKGYWLKASELSTLNLQQQGWFNLPKASWISPILTRQQPLSGQELKTLVSKHFKEHRYGLMIAGTELSQTQINHEQPYHQEVSRYIIVPDDWPYSRQG